MKKVLAFIIAAVMTVSLTPAASAYVAPGEDGNINVPYVDTDIILPDGTINEGEWSEGVTIGADNFVSWFLDAYTGPIELYTAWNENGFYIAAEIPDNMSTFVESGLGTRFQIALNPGAIIDSSFPGLFFSFVPYAGTDELHVYRHNWRSNVDEAYDAYNDEGYTGKYTVTDDGWCFECIIPWSMIATADRTTAVNSDGILLTDFDPNEEGAFCTAMICYIPCDGENVLATGRTCMGGNVADWNVSSYDVTFLFEAKQESGDPESGSDPVEEPVDIEATDINGDDSIDNKDVVFLFRYVSGTDKEADESKYDVNGDGSVDNKDVVLLFRSLSKADPA